MEAGVGAAVTERPILFSAPMVRALLAGRKTQTRRVVKPVRGFERHNICKPDMAADPWAVWWHGDETDRVGCLQYCPYGKPGGTLWVRETWYCDDYRVQRGPYKWVEGAEEMTVYRADDPTPYEAEQPTWRPSIHMPRWASRITLQITDVRVERVQDISEADAEAEGITGHDALVGQIVNPYRTAYADLWDSINGKKHPWDTNPWVWVVTFEVCR